MGRTNNQVAVAPSSKLSRADRSAYFARREAAKVLRTVLHGDARRRAVASIKSLVFSPSVRNKKATFALVCETLKRCCSTSNIELYFQSKKLVPARMLCYRIVECIYGV